MNTVEPLGARALAAYGDAIGQSRRELVTPALVLDLPAAEGNIDRMAKPMAQSPATLRPHIKVHKSPELSRRQAAAGAEGLSMDNFHGARTEGFENALFVATSVVSAPAGRVVVDAGSKSIGVGGDPFLADGGQGALRFDEEHGIFDGAVAEDLQIGDIVELIPGYAPATVNLYDVFHVVDGETVIDVWPVATRGPGHGGLLERATPAPDQRDTARHTSPEDLERN